MNEILNSQAYWLCIFLIWIGVLIGSIASFNVLAMFMNLFIGALLFDRYVNSDC